jgi:hypothetical protein
MAEVIFEQSGGETEVHLVTISSQEENDFILEHTGGGVWIGFTDQYDEGDWEWVTGEDVVYTNWDEGEPNNDGEQHWAYMFETGQWDDLNDEPMGFVYEIDEAQDFELTEFEITINGNDQADIEAGESAMVTIQFDDTGAETYAGMMAIFYDADFDDMLEPDEDLNLFEEDGEGPAVLLVDNMEPDQNPDIGIIEFTLDAQDDDGPGFLTLFQHTSWHFTSYDPDFDDYSESTATLNVNGFESDYSISGQTHPPTPNMMVFAFSDSMEMEIPHLTVTQEDGSYHVDVAQAGSYMIGMDDGLDIYENLYVSQDFQFVDVYDHVHDIDFEIVEYNTVVWGHVTNPEGDGIHDAEVYFSYHDDSLDFYIESDAWTDENGYYELWLQGGYEYDVHAWAYGYNDHNDYVYVEGDFGFEYNVTLEPWNNDEFGQIEGTVFNPDGNPIQDAWVNAWNDNHWQEAWTDENGHYWMEVPAGEYEMEAGAGDYHSDHTWGVEVYPWETTYIDFWLDWAEEEDFTFLGEFGGHEYYLSDYNDTWTNANEMIQGWGEPQVHMATISSQEENDFINQASDFIDVWIGFTDMHEEGVWGWVTGEEVTYTNWAEGEPNNSGEEDFAHMWGVDGTWNDHQAEHIARFVVEVEGYGESATILHVSDVPDDQGGRVYVNFARSIHDTDTLRTPEMYTVERLDGDTWVGLNSVSAYGNDEYVVEATTLADSTSENDAIMTYRIIAAMDEGNFASDPGSGYSVDNIAPGAPTGVTATVSGGVVYLEWAHSDANDLDYYAVYRSTDPGFVPGEENMIGSSEGVDFADDVEELGDYYYAVTALDIHENESDPSELVNVTLLSLEDVHGLPEIFSFHQNYPNPFNPETRIRYDLPEETNVSILIYDLMGRQIRTLVNQQVSAGYHSVMWNATSDMGSPVSAGVYIYAIQAGKFRDVKKMILLK